LKVILFSVMAGLDLASNVFLAATLLDVDAPHKAGHDERDGEEPILTTGIEAVEPQSQSGIGPI
jgi:hypothetical protein